MINSINKGKNFERECVKLLNKLTEATWHRTSNSGAMATAQGIKDSRFKGDLFTEDQTYKDYCIECKVTGKKLTLDDLFNNKSLIWQWWEQTLRESNPDKYPVLIFKFGRSNTYILAENITFKPKRIMDVGGLFLGVLE